MKNLMTDPAQWAQIWACPHARVSDLRATMQRELFQSFNSSRTVPRTGIIHIRPQHLSLPGTIGTYLLEQMRVDLTPLPSELQHLIAATSCQHRIEFWRRAGEIPRLVQYDGRLMYGGCCQGLGIAAGQYRDVSGEDITHDERGRAEVVFQPPPAWVGVGLLAVKEEDDDGWLWPTAPCWQRTWADLCEIRFARQQGWEIIVLRKITWPEARPLDLWAERLSRLSLRAQRVGDRELAGCYRAILLQSIGRLHNLGYRDQRSVVPVGDERATLEAVELIDGEGAHIRERVAFDKAPQFIHPEWSAAIWARCHLRVARALVSVPRESVLAVRGDAIYMTEDPGWPDNGQAGTLRRQQVIEGPMPAPQSWTELWSALEAC